jgi:hypothetical protein
MERLRTGIKPHPFSAFTMSPVHLRPDRLIDAVDTV